MQILSQLKRILNAQISAKMLLLCTFLISNAQSATTEDLVKNLHEKQLKLADQLNNNPFNRPLYLNSEESPNTLKGEIYALIDHPFAKVSHALNNPTSWCDVLILHINTKYCQATNSKDSAILNVHVGKKHEQSLAETSRIVFNFQQIQHDADYFSILLNAEKGPMGTSDYRIALESVPLKNGKTFLHFTYTYSFGLSGKIGMKTYLATIGKDKVGFTQTTKQNSEHPQYIQGVRAVVERNTMRYYLAIDAYLAALSAPVEAQAEKRFQLWYASTEQYPRQLHELEKEAYLRMKRKEYQRQQAIR